MTPEETIKGIEGLIAHIPELITKVEKYAANDMRNSIAVRVFNRLENTDGASLGDYSKTKKGNASSWQIKRFEAGRPTFHRDLNFTGNLFVALDIGTLNGRWVMGFKDGHSISLDNYSPKTKKRKLKNGKTSKSKPIVYPGTAKLSELIEENLGMVIFSPNVSEVGEVVRTTNIFAQKELDRLSNKHLK